MRDIYVRTCKTRSIINSALIISSFIVVIPSLAFLSVDENLAVTYGHVVANGDFVSVIVICSNPTTSTNFSGGLRALYLVL